MIWHNLPALLLKVGLFSRNSTLPQLLLKKERAGTGNQCSMAARDGR